MAKKVNRKELQYKSIPELQEIKSQLQRTRPTPLPPQKKPRPPDYETRIVGGDEVYPPCGFSDNPPNYGCKYPFMGYLRDFSNGWACGASLIHPEWVLTAAHCIDGPAGVSTHQDVTFGQHDLNNWSFPVITHQVDEIIIHPDYSLGSQTPVLHDIALLHLETPSTYIPIPLVTPIDWSNCQGLCCNNMSGTPENLCEVEFPQTECNGPIFICSTGYDYTPDVTIMGWGLTETGETSDVLLEVTTTYHPGECSWWESLIPDWIYEFLYDSTYHMCIGDTDASAGSGDSGGPAIQYNFLTDRYEQYGVAGYVDSLSSIYTRVEYYLPWIEQYVPLYDPPTNDCPCGTGFYSTNSGNYFTGGEKITHILDDGEIELTGYSCDSEWGAITDNRTNECCCGTGYWITIPNEITWSTCDIECANIGLTCKDSVDGVEGGSCCTLGDMNGDGGWNVLDVVSLANCILANNCAYHEHACAADINGDGGYNVLDIVKLINCILANNCCDLDGNDGCDSDATSQHQPPPGVTREEQDRILKEIINGPQDIQSIKSVLDQISDSGVIIPLPKPKKLSDRQLQSMSIEQLQETKRQLQSRPKYEEHIIGGSGETTTTRGCLDQVCMSIESVDTDAGTLDINMTSQSGCFVFSTGGAFDASFNDQNVCEVYQDGGNIWFNGEVYGFQFDVEGVTVTGASGGAAEDAGFTTSTSNTIIFGVSFTGGFIPAGSDLLLTTISFSDVSAAICFAEQDCSTGACSNQISGALGQAISADWGDCYCELSLDCNGDCGGDAEVDCAGVCGGDAVVDCTGVCGGDAVVDCTGVCGGGCSVCDCFGQCGGSAEYDACGICGGTEENPNNCDLPFYPVGYAYHPEWGEDVQCYCDNQGNNDGWESFVCAKNWDSTNTTGCGGDAENHPQYGPGGVNCTDNTLIPGAWDSYNAGNTFWNYGQYCPDARDHDGHPDYQDYCPYGYGCGTRTHCGLLWKCCSNSCASGSGMNYRDNECPGGWGNWQSDDRCTSGWCPCEYPDDNLYCRPGWEMNYPYDNRDNPCELGNDNTEEGKHFDVVCLFDTSCDPDCYNNDGTLKPPCNPVLYDQYRNRDDGSDISPVPPKEGNIGQYKKGGRTQAIKIGDVVKDMNST